MTAVSGASESEATAIREIRARFLALTGLNSVDVHVEGVGPERFLSFVVGRDATLYRHALVAINRERGPSDPFHGSLTLSVVPTKDTIRSQEVQLLRALIQGSLRVTSASLREAPLVEFAPFRAGEETSVTRPANYAIQGRRGVGKSTLILMACRRIIADGNIAVWLDLQPMRGAATPSNLLVVLSTVLKGAVDFAHESCPGVDTESLAGAVRLVEDELQRLMVTHDDMRAAIPEINARIVDFFRSNRKQIHVFLDDVHFLSTELQPLLLDLMAGSFKGANAWLKVAGLKHFLRLYDPAQRIGLQPAHDIQSIDLDLTLVDPLQARNHLVGILTRFLTPCGFKRPSALLPERAIERLVWCSAGVPRDFLSLFDRAIGHALQHQRRRVGVEEVNLSVGDFAQAKMDELEQDTTEDGPAVRDALERLQRECLDHHHANSFLIRQKPRHRGYQLLQKLVDLRLVHLIHPNITPGKAGERYEAYLLDYSFYTGIRRRHRLTELKITPEKPPRYSDLRKLPRIQPEVLTSVEA